MSKNDATPSALDQVAESRRGFLSKLLAGGAAVAALPTMATVALGQPAEGKGKGKGGKGKGGKGRPNIAELAKRLIKEYGGEDGKLDEEELTKALTAMFSRFGKGKGKGGKGKGKGKGDE